MTDETIFTNALLKATPEERTAYLVDICGGDLVRLKRLQGLLQAAKVAPRFLEEPAIAVTSQDDLEVLKAVELDQSESGLIISEKYKLLQKLGEGGMGTIYLVEQTQPINRKVAIKIIKAGMDTKTVLRRFEVERQALALMDHPNIAKVFDAGTTSDGRPFFVM